MMTLAPAAAIAVAQALAKPVPPPVTNALQPASDNTGGATLIMPGLLVRRVCMHMAQGCVLILGVLGALVAVGMALVYGLYAIAGLFVREGICLAEGRAVADEGQTSETLLQEGSGLRLEESAGVFVRCAPVLLEKDRHPFLAVVAS
jgi:hypothetical protein